MNAWAKKRRRFFLIVAVVLFALALLNFGLAGAAIATDRWNWWLNAAAGVLVTASALYNLHVRSMLGDLP